jgi:transaldolase
MTAVPTGAAASPLLKMARDFGTDWWNDSCDPADLASAIERGATGATSNPTIVLDVMRANRDRWWPRVRELATANPAWTEVELAWATAEEVAAAGAAVLEPVFHAHGGRKGRQAIQTNPADYRNSGRMVEQAARFAGLAPNIVVKFPATRAGIAGIEEATSLGVTTMATVSFTVSQAVAAAEAAERGIARRAAAGEDVERMTPYVVLMIGRLDDWMKALVERDGLAVDPAAPAWAGIAVFKRTYALFQERGYRSRLLAAATRHPLHWTELIGADAATTLTPAWQARIERSGIEPHPRINVPVDPAIVAELASRVPDFVRAYDPDGLSVDEFDGYGATARTLRAFIASYHDLLSTVRDIVLPDPDQRQR